MIAFLRKWRKENLNNIGKYLLYALGEILLIIIGILIAVGINNRQTDKENNITTCQYLEELNFALEQDKIDVKENLGAFNLWHPKLRDVLNGMANDTFNQVDSLADKISTVAYYVTFLQQSKGKIEELKYSDINLITNRSLKNKVLMYQETKIAFLLEQQRRFNVINDKVDDYFLENRIEKLSDFNDDVYFQKLVRLKYNKHDIMIGHYNILLTELNAIEKLLALEMEEKCE